MFCLLNLGKCANVSNNLTAPCIHANLSLCCVASGSVIRTCSDWVYNVTILIQECGLHPCSTGGPGYKGAGQQRIRCTISVNPINFNAREIPAQIIQHSKILLFCKYKPYKRQENLTTAWCMAILVWFIPRKKIWNWFAAFSRFLS